MPTSPFERIYADIRKDVPSVIEATFRQEAFRVLDDFTQHTNIWQEEVPVAIVPNTTTYNLTVVNGKISRMLFVYMAGADVKRWPANGVSMRVPGILSLQRKTTSAENWIVVVAKRTSDPVDTATKYPVIDDWIVDKYADTLGRGILARIQLQPQKPYSNPMLAAVNQRAYVSGRSEARVNDEHHNVLNAQRWMFPQGWATTQKKGFV